MGFLDQWLDGAEEEPLRALATKPAPAKRHELANFIAGQIREEQNLSMVRMNWNLTFQGFCVAGYAVLAAAEKTSPARFVIQVAVALFAATVAFLTLNAIIASQRQRAYLKRTWAHAELGESFPEPFSSSGGSRTGRRAAHWICASTILMWGVLGTAAIVEQDLGRGQTRLEARPVRKSTLPATGATNAKLQASLRTKQLETCTPENSIKKDSKQR